MNCKIIYTSIKLALLSILFIQCKSNNTKKFHFQSVGWTVTVPAYMNIQYSATIYKSLPNTTSQEHFASADKLLLQVVDTGGWRLNGNSLTAGIKPIDNTKSWDEILRALRSDYAGTYNRYYLPKTKVDSVFSKESLDGKELSKNFICCFAVATAENLAKKNTSVNGRRRDCLNGTNDR